MLDKKITIMDIQSFTDVVRYQIHSRYLNNFFTPSSEVIQAVKSYNFTRAQAAKRMANIIKNANFIEQLRYANKITQLNHVPNDAKCILSKNNLTNDNGKTLIIKSEKCSSIFCLHHRFLNEVHNYYNIVHFDDEMYKMFKDWTKKVYLNTIRIEDIEPVITTFMQYNNKSKINLLYVKFNTICDL